jgi:hypothetical protein
VNIEDLAKLGRAISTVMAGLGVSLLTVYIRIKVQVDLQADKSSVVVKGPFFPQV